MLIFTLLFSGLTHAQSMDMKNIKTDDEGTTTIEIKKGRKDGAAKTENKWEVQDGTSDLEGEPGATNKEARAAWTKACEAWKKDFRADNKDNKILSMSCGTASCGGDAGSKVCTSKATYKVKTQMN